MRGAVYMIFVLAMTAGAVADCNGFSNPEARQETKSLPEIETSKVDANPNPNAGADEAYLAQLNDSAVSAPDPDISAVLQPQEFADWTTLSILFVITTSELATEKATLAETKTFARHLIEDHSTIRDSLRIAAGAEGLKVPTALDDGHQAQVHKLAEYTGNSFDQSFLAVHYATLEEVGALFTAYSIKGTQGALREFARRTLPMLGRHLEAVKGLTVDM